MNNGLGLLALVFLGAAVPNFMLLLAVTILMWPQRERQVATSSPAR
jgi:hypothetical protein